MHLHYPEANYLAGHYLLIYLDRLICKERRISCCHFIYKHTEGPPVHCFVVALQIQRDDKKIRTRMINELKITWNENYLTAIYQPNQIV